MNPSDYAKTIADFWTAQGQALLKAQQQVGKAMADGAQAMTSGSPPEMPALPADLSTGVTELAAAGRSVMELWSAATDMCGTLATTFPGAATGDTTVKATFRKMIDPQSWMAGAGEIDEALGRMAEGPRFADLWEVERRYAHVVEAWMTVRRRGFEHGAVVLEAWLEAGRDFMAAMAGKPGSDAKATLALWSETANRRLLDTQRSESFLKTQAATIRASTELRLAQQDLVEHFGRQYGFPTRAELDDVHRTVTELRRELRALQRERRAPAPPAPPPVRQAPVKRASRGKPPAKSRKGPRQ
jgi:polyhydroxyalkanoate synthase subunit PhaE